MAIASRKTKLSLMQNDKVLLTIEYIVLSLLRGVLGNSLRVLLLVKYLRLYSSFNLTARALRFIYYFNIMKSALRYQEISITQRALSFNLS